MRTWARSLPLAVGMAAAILSACGSSSGSGTATATTSSGTGSTTKVAPGSQTAPADANAAPAAYGTQAAPVVPASAAPITAPVAITDTAKVAANCALLTNRLSRIGLDTASGLPLVGAPGAVMPAVAGTPTNEGWTMVQTCAGDRTGTPVLVSLVAGPAWACPTDASAVLLDSPADTVRSVYSQGGPVSGAGDAAWFGTNGSGSGSIGAIKAGPFCVIVTGLPDQATFAQFATAAVPLPFSN